MEMRGCRIRGVFALLLLVALVLGQQAAAQPPLKKYTIKNGRMIIELGRDISAGALDSFVKQFDLQDLYLKDFLNHKNPDSLLLKGWRVDLYNEVGIIISKELEPFQGFQNPADRIVFAEKDPAHRAAPGSLRSAFGYNRFRNKPAFEVRADSIVRFFLRNHTGARNVRLAGSFNNWDPQSLEMRKTASGWELELALAPGKYWYKFIVDGNWKVDDDNHLRENDGEGNINSVYFKTNHVFALPGHQNASSVFLAGSFNNWKQRDLRMEKSGNGWILPVYLDQGTHSYKFIVDGRWMPDPQNPNTIPDGEGDLNSVVSFGKPLVFKLEGFKNAREVRLAGNFNNWRGFELIMKPTATGWELPYVLGPGNYEYKFIVDGLWMADPANPPTIPDGNSILVLDPNFVFRLKGFAQAKNVFLAGSFNNWNPSGYRMKFENGDWVVPVYLGQGKHLYKFVVDGNWILDPSNQLWEQNEFGTGNSILWIGR